MRRLTSWSRSAATLRTTTDSFPMNVSWIVQEVEGQTDGIPLFPTPHPDIYSSSFPEAGVCGPPPRDVRGLVNSTTTTQLDQQQVRATQQLSVKTTFNYQLQLAVSTTTWTRRQTINIKKDADRSRLMIISKFCQLSTLKSGFFNIFCHLYVIINIFVI